MSRDLRLGQCPGGRRGADAAFYQSNELPERAVKVNRTDAYFQGAGL